MEAPLDGFVEALLEARRDSLPRKTSPETTKQSLWDRPLVELDKAEVRRSATGLVDRARLDAACGPHSADWLSALPIAACGLTLDNEAVRVAVGLRLGQDLCAPHSCICGGLVGQDGHHGFVCRKAQGRALRHHTINDVLWRALNRAGVPSTREPAGLFRTDGRRPDGATLIPWSGGRYLAWDATIVHTCAASYVSPQAASMGPASVQAANRKTTKYGGLPSTHIFQPVAIETLGPINPSACDFISEIGRRISTISGDRRETSFLYQRLSITIQRYNLVAFSGTFSSAVDDEA